MQKNKISLLKNLNNPNKKNFIVFFQIFKIKFLNLVLLIKERNFFGNINFLYNESFGLIT